MKYRVLGRSGLKVSMIGIATGGLDPLGIKSGRSEAEMRDFLRFAFDCNINLFDTSPGYGNGRSERILGSALKGLPRDELVVSTKIALAEDAVDDENPLGWLLEDGECRSRAFSKRYSRTSKENFK